MKTRSKFLIIFTIFLSMFLCGINVYALNADGQEINYLTNEEIEEIEKLIEENMSEGNIPGLSITIVKGDKIVYQRGFGYSDIDEEKLVTSETLFELASNSKAFTALGILNLEESGQINLNDQVTKYIPWLKLKYKGKEIPLTIEQVMHHTSGISSSTIDKIPISNEDSALEDTVRTLIGIELDSEPGKTFQYATINYDVLGLIIEKTRGDTYEKYMEEIILKPMELNNTYLFRNEDINDRIASGYKLAFLKPKLYEAPIYRGNKPAGYVISSGEDMGKWLKIQMDTMEELNFDREIIKRSHEASSVMDQMGNKVLYGGGWFLEPENHISHGGMNPNYSSFVIFNDKEKIGVAVLTNLCSNYVENIGMGVNGILNEEYIRKDMKDSMQIIDRIAVGVIFVLSILVLVFLFFITKLLINISRNQRNFKFNGIRDILKFIISIIFMLGLNYSIYILPKVLSNGGSWKTAFVWSPHSLKVALYLLYIAIGIIYLYFILISYFKKESKLSFK